MKNVIILLFCASIHLGYGQEKSTFYPFTQGTTKQITSYTKDGKIINVAAYRVATVSMSAINSTEVAEISVKIESANDKSISEFLYGMTFQNDTLFIDKTTLIPLDFYKKFSDITIKDIGKELIIPNRLAVGQVLPNAVLNMKVNLINVPLDVAILFIDRKVEKREKIKTTVGTFDCVVISHTMIVDMCMNSVEIGTTKQWITKGIGMVKQEKYTKNDELASYSLLTSFKN